jgi:phage terminase small subunit
MSRPDSVAAQKITIGIMDGLDIPIEEASQLQDIIGKLSMKEARYVLEYIADMNVGQAAFRMGYTKESSNICGTLLLSRPQVRQAVDTLLELRARSQALVINRLLIGLDEIAHFDRREVENPDGSIKPMSEWPSYAGQALTGFEIQEIWSGRGQDRVKIGEIKKAKFVDPIRARELLGRHLRLWGEPQINVNQTNINAQNVQINQRIDVSDFTPEELQVALKLGLKVSGNALELAPGLSGEEINESAIIGT